MGNKKKKVTLEDLAMMTARGFETTANKDEVNARFDAVDKRFLGLEIKIDDLDRKVDRVDARVDEVYEILTRPVRERWFSSNNFFSRSF